jgi:hypothetical protein
MSPIFGKKGSNDGASFAVVRDPGRLPQSMPDENARTAQVGSGLDAEVERLAALSLPQLAAEVMTKVFTDFASEPDRKPLELFNIARVLAPSECRDQAESDGRMHDLVGEGVQLLEQARLVRLEPWAQGQFYHVGYITTRLGQSALEGNAVERILGGGSL